jgi:hypothetical protein
MNSSEMLQASPTDTSEELNVTLSPSEAENASPNNLEESRASLGGKGSEKTS